MAQSPSDSAGGVAVGTMRGVAQSRDEAVAADYGIARVFPVFSVAFAVVYFYSVFTDTGPIRYYPLLSQWSLESLGTPDEVGPVMMWYGWVINGVVAGVVAALLAMLAPRRSLERIWAGPAVWVVVLLPVALFLVILYRLREYFL
jgi:hypothetical protein